MMLIVNSLEPRIQLTTDSLDRNQDGRMAILDLKVWIEEIDGKKVITHSFYKKEFASPLTILKKSSLSLKIKWIF